MGALGLGELLVIAIAIFGPGIAIIYGVYRLGYRTGYAEGRLAERTKPTAKEP